MLPLLGLLLIFCCEPSRCQGKDEGFTFDGDLRHFAVASDTVYIATEKNLYQLTHNLNLVRRVSQRGILVSDQSVEALLNAKFHRVSENDVWNATFSVNVLLPFVANGSLIICGLIDNGCGYCEVLRATDISEVQHRELVLVGSSMNGSASVAFLGTVEERTGNQIYILTASQQPRSKDTRCSTGVDSIVLLHNTNDAQFGSIFSDSPKPTFKNKPNSYAEFVDGFQIGLIFYLFSNVPSEVSGNKVRLVWLESKKSKSETIRSLRGATLRIPSAGADSSRLLASSVIPGGPPVLWSGVFAVDGWNTDTVLVVFDVSPDLSGQSGKDPDFCTDKCDSGNVKTLIPKTELFRQNHMTSVLAVRQRDFVVFFIGTGDGQLIKFAMDKNYHTSCPRVLYRSNFDRKVLHRLHLDEVDHRHVYVPFKNQMKRIPVATCSMYTSLQECWSAQDPHCIWCDSTQSCTFEVDCNGTGWLAIPDDFQQQKLVSYRTETNSSGQIILKVQTHLTMGPGMVTHFTCQYPFKFPLCSSESPRPNFPQCTCILSNSTLPTGGVIMPVRIRLGRSQLLVHLNLTNCPNITGPPTADLCRQCIEAGCGWGSNRCSWANQAVANASICQTIQSGMNITKPEIHSISPSVVSFYGRNRAVLLGRNLRGVTRVRIQRDMDCSPQESPVLDRTDVNLTFHIPSADNKGSVKVCVVLPDGSCVGNARVTYQSSPSCTDLTPNSAWISGKRTITVKGSHMEFVEAVIHSHAQKNMLPPLNFTSTQLTYDTPEAGDALTSTVYLKVANETLTCSETITYYPDPVFTDFTSTLTGSDVSINIQKKADKLEIKTAELSVWGIKDGKQYECKMEIKETNNDTDFFICEIKNPQVVEFQHLLIKFGSKLVILKPKSSHLLLILLVLLLIPCIIIAVVIIYRRKQNQLTTVMNNLMENLELDIRNDIRQGFIDLQTEKTDLLENVGAIPFLDYKHFASRIFFPENEALMASCIKDIGQDAEKVQLDECCHGLSRLIQDQFFLTSMVHTLEEQKNFTIKDKCTLASLLTVALHSNLLYLTEVMESLLKDLMQQNSNTQPKLLLRRTESIVEKLLTNWMSICLYGFLRENVGQHLFLMVSALTQQISKGPVDCVTEKALYTLSEDWLLWQAQDFSSLMYFEPCKDVSFDVALAKLKVLFAVGTDGEVSEPLEVDALTCDTIEQVKEKILSTFKAKFGFPYNTPLRNIDIEFERDGSFVRLEEVDASSEVLGDVTMLNTLKHYKVTDGAKIKVLSKKTHPPVSPQGSLKDDHNFSGKYFHLIDPDVDEDQRKNPERKKLKLKEVHLTKLLSTKVAVHSFVENLFRCIWGMQHSKAPHAIKYFFDFLDAQAENMKITDPDVLHIWKTNSLPLRFWVNILKNPQFVFDMEKTPHLDGCLSVIAQAFMDSFSLSDIQLGKHTPTNKLLYTKDVPKFKQEVKAYYKQVREQQPIPASEFKDFLLLESKKHDNEFNEAEALRELYKFIQKYFTEIQEKLNQSGATSELKEQLHHVKNLFDGLKSCSWN